jgi:hypothetical protein
MMRYTPGPWKMRPNGDISSAPRAGKATQVCSISWGMSASEEKPGNARLIQAAPQMSEALDELMLLVSQPTVAAAIMGNAKLLPKARQIVENARIVMEAASGEPQPAWPRVDPSRPKLE